MLGTGEAIEAFAKHLIAHQVIRQPGAKVAHIAWLAPVSGPSTCAQDLAEVIGVVDYRGLSRAQRRIRESMIENSSSPSMLRPRYFAVSRVST